VGDAQRALADIARRLQRERSVRVVAVTGSNGKTSVKALLRSILERAGSAYVTPGNRNNEIGVPLAAIDAPDDSDFAVYEMGAGKPGDIAYLTDIVRPDVALVNNIGAAHLERMGSLRGIAETKGAIYDALPPDGVAVINADDAFGEYFRRARAGSQARALRDRRQRRGHRARHRTGRGGVALPAGAPGATVRVDLPLPGRHSVMNALAAAACTHACGVAAATIAEGLAAARPVAGRQVTHELADGVILIDDSYNANPGSLAAAIDTLAASGDAAWLVLGDMHELGPGGEAMHADAGRRAKDARIARLYTLGTLSAAAGRRLRPGGAWLRIARCVERCAARRPARARRRRSGPRAGSGEGVPGQRHGPRGGQAAGGRQTHGRRGRSHVA
jgi:UDP-N-acetylmuramoyl-tripeptide--D-alanyl-D-alanine ligase